MVTAHTASLLGPVAQWLEPAAHNGLVAGSSPAGPTSLRSRSVRRLPRRSPLRAKAGAARELRLGKPQDPSLAKRAASLASRPAQQAEAGTIAPRADPDQCSRRSS